MFEKAHEMIAAQDFNQIDVLMDEGNALKSRLSEMRHQEQINYRREGSNNRLDLLYLNTLQETQELVSTLRHLLRATKRYHSADDLIEE